MFLELGAHVSLKEVTTASFGTKKTLKILIFRLLFQSKSGTVIEKNYVSLKNLEFSYKEVRQKKLKVP